MMTMATAVKTAAGRTTFTAKPPSGPLHAPHSQAPLSIAPGHELGSSARPTGPFHGLTMTPFAAWSFWSRSCANPFAMSWIGNRWLMSDSPSMRPASRSFSAMGK